MLDVYKCVSVNVFVRLLSGPLVQCPCKCSSWPLSQLKITGDLCIIGKGMAHLVFQLTSDKFSKGCMYVCTCSLR